MDNAQTGNRLAHFPISFFAIVMGLAGLTIAWQKVGHVFALDLPVATPLLMLTAAVFLVIAGLYGLKLVRHGPAVLSELRHPVKLNFFPALSISLLLLAIGFLQVEPAWSRPLWIVGTALHLLATLYVVNVWMHHQHLKVQHLNPAWFIPAVGNVLVPVAGVPLGYVELSWLFFSIGLMFWVILMAIIFYRVLFHDPIDQRLMPTLFILIAPPAVGFIAYTRLVGELDVFGRLLYFMAAFLTLVLFTQVTHFLRLRFFLSWWAYSFPLAAIGISSLLMYELSGVETYRWIGAGLVLLLSALIGVLLVRTLGAVAGHRICQPEH
jgi:tellurite resistance protein